MERLDNAITKLEDFYNGLQLGEDALMPYENNETIIDWLKELKAYRYAEEQGLLLRLPCKVGDTVWLADEKFSKDIKCLSIRYIEIVAFIWFRAILEDGSGILFADYEIGKKVFLTKEEAEQKLAEMKGEV